MRKSKKQQAEPGNYPARHLLHHPKSIECLIQAAHIGSHETVLDIGAGAGALAIPLARLARRVIAVEQNGEDAARLRAKAADMPALTVIQADIRQIRLPREPFCVVANIPFSITTPIMEKLLGAESHGFQRGAILMEAGAAKRFIASSPADPRLVAWRLNFTLRRLQTVPRGHFSPPPRVDGIIVGIVRKEKPLLPAGQYRRFCSFASAGLRIQGISIYDAMRGYFTAEQMKRVLQELKVDRMQSAAALSPEQWGFLFSAMLRHVPSYRWPR